MFFETIHLQKGLSNATLTVYLMNSFVENQPLKPAVIICPGGAFLGITEKEAEPVAMQFLSAGYQAFVLKYSVGELARFPSPFIDAARAVLMVRSNAAGWGIDPDKISICGFSTGGQVAVTLATTWKEDYYAKALNADNQLFRPNFLILGYPLLNLWQFKNMNQDKSPEMATLLEMMFTCIYGTMDPSESIVKEWSIENLITSEFPPTFLWTTAEDALVDVNESLEFIKILAARKVPYEFHIFEKGAHGLSLGDQTVGYTEEEVRKQGNTHKWMELALQWML